MRTRSQLFFLSCILAFNVCADSAQAAKLTCTQGCGNFPTGTGCRSTKNEFEKSIDLLEAKGGLYGEFHADWTIQFVQPAVSQRVGIHAKVQGGIISQVGIYAYDSETGYQTESAASDDLSTLMYLNTRRSPTAAEREYLQQALSLRGGAIRFHDRSDFAVLCRIVRP